MRKGGRKPHIPGSLRAGLLCALLGLLFSACASSNVPAARTVRVVLEEGEGYSAPQHVFDLPAGQPLSAELRPEDGFTITGCDCEGALLTGAGDGTVQLTLPEIRYTRTVRIFTEMNPYTVRYHLDFADAVLTLTYPATHLRINTAAGDEASIRATGQAPGEPGEPSSAGGSTAMDAGAAAIQASGEPASAGSSKDTGTGGPSPEGRSLPLLSADGTCLLTGWTTERDGGGERISLGSRTDVAPGRPLDLYADWKRFSDEDAFEYEVTPSGQAAVTSYRGSDRELVIPAYLGGRPVAAIREGAFAGLAADSVVLPPTLRDVGLRAFENASLTELTFYDSLTGITDYAFSGCGNLRTIRINAVRPPVYSGTYYDTFADKMDRLRLLAGDRKIILFSGSSSRFGCDCALLDEAFPDYGVVNMGVFAYTNALPQLDLIRLYAGSGDILIHSPEFDASLRQFCTTDAMDSAFFRMIESDYGLLSLLDYRDYGGVLSAFSTYQKEREGMEAGDYRVSAASFDEDRNPVSEPSYNVYGDYVLYRPNASDDAPIYDLPVEYTASAFPKDRFIDPLNTVYGTFLEKGVRVFFTYAPRNREAVSDKSTEEARRALDAYFRETLRVPVISDIEDSLYPGRYLYGTDNHLSTEGVQIRTDRLIRDLRAELEKEEMP